VADEPQVSAHHGHVAIRLQRLNWKEKI
jgi:hypothetical protein